MTMQQQANEPATPLENPLAAPGLYYLPDFLTPEQQAFLVAQVDAAVDQWRSDLSRRTQHYGWRYDYQAKAITPDMYLGQLPNWLEPVAQLLQNTLVHPVTNQPLFVETPTQCIVNEYIGSQGIAEHTDHPGFGPAIATISLLDDRPMHFGRRYKQPAGAVELQAGSCLLMTEGSRSVWTHEIKRDQAVPRNARRLSLTFRTVRNRDNRNER